MLQLGFPKEFPSQGVFPPVWGDSTMTTQPFSTHHKPVPQGPPLPQSTQGDHPEPLIEPKSDQCQTGPTSAGENALRGGGELIYTPELWGKQTPSE